MLRKDFLKNSVGFLGMAVIAPRLMASNNSEELSCTETNAETAGPFPTIDPASLQNANIVGDRTGIPMTVNITIKNINNNCNALSGAIVDIWHCDREGNYSEYGGTQMQSANYTNYHFLRGRQITDANGLVTFQSLFPSWYQSRATHIHVHIYDSNGTSLLITQIAFPEGSNSAVVQVNAATAYGYTKGMTGYTYNASDNVFSDGVENEMGTITGSVADGFVLTHEVYVSAATTGVADVEAERNFFLGNAYPNPFESEVNIPLSLRVASEVQLSILDLNGRIIFTENRGNMKSGQHQLVLDDLSELSSGRYIVQVNTNDGITDYRQSRVVVKR